MNRRTGCDGRKIRNFGVMVGVTQKWNVGCYISETETESRIHRPLALVLTALHVHKYIYTRVERRFVHLSHNVSPNWFK